MRIYVAVEPIDLRNGIDGLAGICRKKLERDPYSGSLFIFRNKRGKTIKILLYDGQGFWLFVKRLSKGIFKWWPGAKDGKRTGTGAGGDIKVIKLTAPQLQLLIWNGNPQEAEGIETWRALK
ncbi:MAG: transposase [Planctomycetota bacterium]|nr:transposase [Planctomycetota bacterium]